MRFRLVSLSIVAALVTAGCASPAANPSDGGSQVVVVEDGSGGQIETTLGTGAVVGTVLTDAGFGLPGARVTVFGAEQSSISNATGGFIVKNVQPGKRLIHASHDQYFSAETEVAIEAGKVYQVTVTLAAKESNPGYRPHFHDHWRGSDAYVFYEGRYEFDTDLTQVPPEYCGYFFANAEPDCWEIRFVPQGEQIIPPGTTRVTVDVSTASSPTFDQEEYIIEVVPPPTYDGAKGSWTKHNQNFRLTEPTQSFEVVVEPGMTDHGHAQWTDWSFTMTTRFSQAGTSSFVPYNLLFRSPIDITITAHKGALLVDPPHPLYWQNATWIPMPDGDASLLGCSFTGYVYGCPARVPNPRMYVNSGNPSCFDACMPPPAGAVVPPGTTRIEFDLESWWWEGQYGQESVWDTIGPDDFVLGYKTTVVRTAEATWDDYTWIEPVSSYTPEPGSHWSQDESHWHEGRHYVVDVLPGEPDPFYARYSGWLFMMGIRGHETAETWDDVECRGEACGSPWFQIKNLVVHNESQTEVEA